MKVGVVKTSWFLKFFLVAGFSVFMHKILFFAGLGKSHFFFSGVNGIAPLLYGAFGGVGASAFVFVGALCRIFKYSFPFASITMGLPTQGSLLVWSFRENKWGSFALSVVLPLCAMLFFVTRPNMGIGAVYALFWLIPMFCYFMQDSLLKTSIQSTFIAHAIGSCLWVATVSMSPEQWVALIPFVIVERVLYVGMQFLIAFFVLKKQVTSNFIDKILACKVRYVNDR